jgi:hypothetical protein
MGEIDRPPRGDRAERFRSGREIHEIHGPDGGERGQILLEPTAEIEPDGRDV